MSDETTRPAEDEPAHEGESLGQEVASVVESAAELGLGAVIAPFTGGETVSIIGSVASMLEGGVDRLTHLGEHETKPDDPDGPDSDPIRPTPPLDDRASDGRE